jgi:hypothetical protein
MPSFIGALDGKHIRMKRPKDSGTMYFNYKLFYSIVLQGVADSMYRFIFIDVGSYGKQSDGGVFQASKLSEFVEDASNFPPDRTIDGIPIPIPYLYVVDDAYPLKPNMMKPYSHRHLSKEEMIFNGRLSRARRCVECAFGIAANKWRLLLKAIETNVDTACLIVKCITILHNVIIDMDGIDESLLRAVEKDLDAKSRANYLTAGRKFNRGGNKAYNVRSALKDYFNSPYGSVNWQDRYACERINVGT